MQAKVILEEHRATNTGESVIFSLSLIDAHVRLGNIRSVVCLGRVCTSRRYLMTLNRHWHEVEKMLVAVNHFGTPVEPRYTALLQQLEGSVNLNGCRMQRGGNIIVGHLSNGQIREYQMLSA
jgi:hypothetical protein